MQTSVVIGRFLTEMIHALRRVQPRKWSTPGSAREDPKNMTPQVARQLRRGTSSYGRLRAGRDVCRVLV